MRFFISFLIVCVFFFTRGNAQIYYWQQEVNYTIDVTLNDKNHTLTGDEKIEYINHSPYIHQYLYFHIWPNAYKNIHTAFARQKVRDGSDEFYFAKKEERGWIDSLDFTVNGKSVRVEVDGEYIDIIKIFLNEPLLPGQSIEINTPFKVKIPTTFSRLGHIDQSYQISQWYPKPAVFDKNGWHPIPYLDQGEFYSEFGKFDVKITLPENYVLAATGVLQNEDEKQWLINRTKQFFDEKDNIESSVESKTLHYIQDNIHDFAWFADKKYNVQKGDVILPHSGKKVDTWYMYTSAYKKSVEKAMEDLHDATYFYSKFVGDYPYSSVTAVTGPLGAGGGMEYPMITITGPSAIIHEVGHNWFYGILGTNERAFAWMDEGLNSFFEQKTYHEQNKKDSTKSTTSTKNVFEKIFSGDQKITSEFVETRNLNQPVHHHSNRYHSTNYFIQLYQKPVVLMEYLQDYLGEELFIKCFLAYYDKWKFKHPYLEDMQKVFEEISGKDLSWLFHTIIKTNITPNAKIKKVVKNKRGIDALFLSENNMPIKVNLLDKERKKLGSKWIEFKNTTANAYLINANKIAIDDENMIFKTSRGKFSRSGKVLQKYKLPSFDFLLPKNTISRANIGYSPILGTNSIDGTMAGLAFYNTGIRSRKVNYTVAPMYAIGSNDIKGLASANMYFYPRKDFTIFEIGAITQRFQEYNKVGFHASFWNKPDIFDVSWNQKIKISQQLIYEPLSRLNITELSYHFFHNDAVRKFSFLPKLGINSTDNDFSGASILTSIEAKASYEYIKNTRIKMRFFAGVYSALQNDINYQFGLSNGVDYNRENYIYNRDLNYSFTSNGLDGGFRGYQNVLAHQLISLNSSIGIPKIPFSIYYDGAFADNIFYWGAGASLHIIDDNLEIYFPISGTNYASSLPADASDFFKSIRLLIKITLKSSNEIIWEKI